MVLEFTPDEVPQRCLEFNCPQTVIFNSSVYTLSGYIGGGGAGRVLQYKSVTHHAIAVKILHPKQAHMVTELKKEAEAWITLGHMAQVKEADTGHVMIMPFLPFESVSSYCISAVSRAKPVNLGEVINDISDALIAWLNLLKEFHQKRLNHPDPGFDHVFYDDLNKECYFVDLDGLTEGGEPSYTDVRVIEQFLVHTLCMYSELYYTALTQPFNDIAREIEVNCVGSAMAKEAIIERIIEAVKRIMR